MRWEKDQLYQNEDVATKLPGGNSQKSMSTCYAIESKKARDPVSSLPMLFSSWGLWGGGLNLWRDNDDVRRRRKIGYGERWGHVR